MNTMPAKGNVYRDVSYNPQNADFDKLGLGTEMDKADKILRDIETTDLADDATKDTMTTLSHTLSVGNLMYKTAKLFGYNEFEANRYYIAGLVHDAGKIFIDRAILNKPTKLEYNEFIEMNKHAAKSRERLESMGIKDAHIIEVASMHHLKQPWDELLKKDKEGKYDPMAWYPTDANGELDASKEFHKGENTSKPLQMIYMCDVYDALVDSNRPYKKGMSLPKAFGILEKGPADKDKLRKFEQMVISDIREHSKEYTITAGSKDSLDSVNGLSDQMKDAVFSELDAILKTDKRETGRVKLIVSQDRNAGQSVTITNIKGRALAVIGEDELDNGAKVTSSFELIDGIQHENKDAGTGNDERTGGENIEEDIDDEEEELVQ